METDFEPVYRDIPCYQVNPKDGSELVLVPGGWFWMGIINGDQVARVHEKPRHLHYVAPFYMGIACVTVAQFRMFAQETKYDAGSGWQNDLDEHPVRYVSWDDATAYCAWAGLRLPSEAEWELAARGYGALKYPWGNDWENGRRVCWSGQKGPKGSSAPEFGHPDGVSPFGGFQHSGNLWELCADTWDAGIYGRYAQGDFSAPPQGGSRVLRGGSWGFSSSRDFRSEARLSSLPSGRLDSDGFRAAGTVAF